VNSLFEQYRAAGSASSAGGWRRVLPSGGMECCSEAGCCPVSLGFCPVSLVAGSTVPRFGGQGMVKSRKPDSGR
jgi:hypothetical protein